LVRLERLRLIDRQPLAHDTAWLPSSIARPLLEVDFAPGDRYTFVAQWQNGGGYHTSLVPRSGPLATGGDAQP
jgi:DNA-binding GntR family transcriptional regulator